LTIGPEAILNIT